MFWLSEQSCTAEKGHLQLVNILPLATTDAFCLPQPCFFENWNVSIHAYLWVWKNALETKGLVALKSYKFILKYFVCFNDTC